MKKTPRYGHVRDTLGTPSRLVRDTEPQLGTPTGCLSLGQKVRDISRPSIEGRDVPNFMSLTAPGSPTGKQETDQTPPAANGPQTGTGNCATVGCDQPATRHDTGPGYCDLHGAAALAWSILAEPGDPHLPPSRICRRPGCVRPGTAYLVPAGTWCEVHRPRLESFGNPWQAARVKPPPRATQPETPVTTQLALDHWEATR